MYSRSRFGDGFSLGLPSLTGLIDSSVFLCEQTVAKTRSGHLLAYIEVWHTDVFHFLNMKRSKTSQSMKAEHLSFALHIPDILCVVRLENIVFPPPYLSLVVWNASGTTNRGACSTRVMSLFCPAQRETISGNTTNGWKDKTDWANHLSMRKMSGRASFKVKLILAVPPFVTGIPSVRK
jgi:hypothetical protein